MNTPWSSFAGSFAIAFAVRVLLIGFGGLWLTRRTWFRRRRVYGLEVPPGQVRTELRYALAVVAFDALFLPLLTG